MVEAVIVLPLLIFLLAAGSHMATLYQAKQKVLVVARGCAWQYANEGCRSEDRIQECQYADGGRLDERAVDERLEREASAGIEGIGQVPLVGSLVRAIFGTTTVVTASRAVEGRLGDDAHHFVEGRFFLMCNEETRTAEVLTKDVFTDLYDAATD